MRLGKPTFEAPDGLKVWVLFKDIMKRIEWAAKRAGYCVPEIDLSPYHGREVIDGVSGAGWCDKAGLRQFDVGIRTDPAWLIAIEEVLVHEAAHSIAWESERKGVRIHTTVWSSIYGQLYHGYFDLEKEGPKRPPFVVEVPGRKRGKVLNARKWAR